MRTTSLMDDQVSFVFGKAKVAPTHAFTMPCLELCATLLATEIGELVQSYLNLTFNLTMYYSDSKMVLDYLTNRTKRFYIYVANWVRRILQHSRPDQWTYIPTHLNPADLGTRAIPVDQLAVSSWLRGPDFVHSRQDFSNPTLCPKEYVVSEDDVEIRSEVTALKTAVSGHSIGTTHFARFSQWRPLTRAIARLIHIASTYGGCKQSIPCQYGKGWHTCTKHHDDIARVKSLIIREGQGDSFSSEIHALQNGSKIPRSSPLSKLDP